MWQLRYLDVMRLNVGIVEVLLELCNLVGKALQGNVSKSFTRDECKLVMIANRGDTSNTYLPRISILHLDSG